MTEEASSFFFNKKDVEKNYVRSQGNGGQKVNKTSSCVFLKHIPSGIMVKCQDTKHQHKNEEIAWKRLEDKLLEIHNNKSYKEEKKERWDQIGNGGRSDKKRTYRFKDDIVIDHETNKTAKLSKFLKGNIQLLK